MNGSSKRSLSAAFSRGKEEDKYGECEPDQTFARRGSSRTRLRMLLPRSVVSLRRDETRRTYRLPSSCSDVTGRPLIPTAGLESVVHALICAIVSCLPNQGKRIPTVRLEIYYWPTDRCAAHKFYSLVRRACVPRSQLRFKGYVVEIGMACLTGIELQPGLYEALGGGGF